MAHGVAAPFIMEDYKNITIDGKQKRLHRYLMEVKLGRELLSTELVHHEDRNIHNNKLSNLRIVTRGEHAKIHNAGARTRFKKKYNISHTTLKYLYEERGYTIQAIADMLKMDFGVIWRRMKEYSVRENMRCVECGRNVESYVRARLCNQCYNRNYLRKYRAKRRTL